MADKEWKLYYWPGFAGRGDMVRLMFEEAGVPYEDVGKTQGVEAVLSFYQGKYDGPPVFAPPIIQNKDGFVLSQTPAILNYLGRTFGLYPEGGPEEEARALQICLTAADYLEEGQNSFHPIERSASHESQKEESKPYVARFTEKRLPKFVLHLEACLQHNNGGDGFFIGNKVTYVDIIMFHVMRATENQFPDSYKSVDIPKLRAFKDRMATRPNIAAFLSSPRSVGFSGSSMM